MGGKAQCIDDRLLQALVRKVVCKNLGRERPLPWGSYPTRTPQAHPQGGVQEE